MFMRALPITITEWQALYRRRNRRRVGMNVAQAAGGWLPDKSRTDGDLARNAGKNPYRKQVLQYLRSKAGGGEKRCPSCAKENDGDAKFCDECGFSLLERVCECGAKLPAGAKFCYECGRKIQQIFPVIGLGKKRIKRSKI